MDSAVENEKSTWKYKNHGEIIPSNKITELAKNVTIAVLLQTLVKAQLNFFCWNFLVRPLRQCGRVQFQSNCDQSFYRLELRRF